MPSYTLNELREWAYSHTEFHVLFDQWKASGYQKMAVPSFDRLNDYKPYTFDNLRIVTWKINKKRYYQDVKNGINTKQCTPIIAIKDSIEIEFYSQHHAAKILKLSQGNINSVLKRNRKITGGFSFKYKSISKI